MLKAVVFIVFMCGVHGRNKYDRNRLAYIPNCNYGGDVYLLDGKTVQVTRLSSTVIELSSCAHATNTSDVFEPEILLHNATELILWAINSWPPLPESCQIEQVSMAETQPVGLFGGCSKLTSLQVTWSSLSETFSIPANWLENCNQLRELTLIHFSASEARMVIDTIPELHELTFDALYNWPTVVREPIFPTPSGREQSIRRVKMTEIFYRHKWGDADFAKRINTTWVEVSAAMVEQLSILSKLEDLYITEIINFDFCPPGNISSVVFKSLRILTISSTLTNRVCFGRLRTAPLLSHLVIGKTQNADTVNLQFKELFSVRAPVLLVEVYHGNTEWISVEDFHLEKEDYLALTDGTKRANLTLSILRMSIECKCQNAWLARAMREGLLTAPDVFCTDTRRPADQRPEWLECDRINCTVAKCECRRDWSRQVLTADCYKADLTEIPAGLLRWPNLSEILVPDNSISNIPEHLPSSLQRLDLSGNTVWQLNEGEVAALFELPSRRVRLSGNPIVCNCDNRVMIKALQVHRNQVEDYDKVRCVRDNTLIKEVNLIMLCAERDREALLAANREAALTISVSVAVVIAVIILVAAVIYYYRRAISIFLFARGWCLYCLREEELDADRRFDVFLSYCHDDHELVHDEILPALDSEYSVCVHTRNWYPGAMIPTQIMLSVEQSRRTVVILSRRFVKSLWGVLEFRTAYANGLSEGRIRVVMVVLDDVLESSDLHGELKAYVRLNTYVRWDDPWFWDKLRYALPHSTLQRSPPQPGQQGYRTHSQEHNQGIPMMPIIERSITSPDVREPDESNSSNRDQLHAINIS